MALSYASPGVYIEEVEPGTKPIEAVGTSMAAFVGITNQASLKAYNAATGERVVMESCLNKPMLVTNWSQFVDTFGNFTPGAFLPDAVYGYFANGGAACYVTSIMALEEGGKVKAAEATIPAAKGTSFKVVAKIPGSQSNDIVVKTKVTGEDTFTLSVGSETLEGLTLKKGDTNVSNAKFESVTISEVGGANAMPVEGIYLLSGGGIQPLSAAEFIGDAAARTGLRGLEAVDDIRLVLCPDLMAGYDGSPEARERVKMVQTEMIAQCEKNALSFHSFGHPARSVSTTGERMAYVCQF